WDRGHRQADRPPAHNRRRLTGSGRHQNLAIAPASGSGLSAAAAAAEAVSTISVTVSEILSTIDFFFAK
ncbi:hypothetical protein ABIB75_008206, partial [Bradyrhizobium sp. GM2.2]|uniref:hypothetical protein n=1 Tax=Bradyrhizobium sp. GM2.2 TaxID=3156358 RepID=UPI003393C00C